ncbi:response regulator transcription factor [Psychromonas hadalis]|uniref:response regulator transcription factor n=1 Tax=Psychromonas hadalis TaxID=211669 RepID=UPI0003B6AFB2|nr:response regulator [Psychromonas hadalis]
MSEKIQLLIVDDEPLNLELMQEILEDDYVVDCVASGVECLTFLENNNPDILLLDVAMAGMDGYEVCKTIKQDSSLTLPIIFVSARGALEDRLMGYEAGGDDYLVKPFNSQELVAKVQSMVSFIHKQDELNTEIQSATDLTMMVITSSGEIGLLVNFLRQTFSCHDLQSLATLVFETLAQLELKSTIQFNGDGERIQTFGCSGNYKPVEAELLELAKSKGRIFHYNQRSIFNFSNASLLIKNMPKEDPEDDLRGRYLDHLCILMEGVDASVIAILKEQKVAQHILHNKALLTKTKQGIVTVQETLQKQKIQAMYISQNLLHQLERDLISLGLDEDQEQHLVTLIEKSTNQLTDLFDEQKVIERFFDDTINSLS